MGLRNKRYSAILGLTAIIAALPVCQAFGAWTAPDEIISATWGKDAGQVGFEPEDTVDNFPRSILINSAGNIYVGDIVNNRIIILNEAGNILASFTPSGLSSGARLASKLQWGVLSGSKLLIKTGDKYQIYSTAGTLLSQFSGVETFVGELQTLSDDSIIVYKSDTKTYYRYTLSGQLIKTSTTRPLELGAVKAQKTGELSYKITITYPDGAYTLSLKGPYEKYERDLKHFIYALSGKAVKKFNSCGRELGSLSIAENQYTLVRPGGRGFDALYDLIAEYGEPVVAPNGDVYTWKRTPDKYSILKWTWVDDPNVPTGPDAPSGLAVVPSIDGLYLTWTASPNDPGCVTKYEIARATTSGGVFSTVGTVDKGVLKYNDTTANAGTTYYYKVRAVAGSEFSPYTAEVSGKR